MYLKYTREYIYLNLLTLFENIIFLKSLYIIASDVHI